MMLSGFVVAACLRGEPGNSPSSASCGCTVPTTGLMLNSKQIPSAHLRIGTAKDIADQIDETGG